MRQLEIIQVRLAGKAQSTLINNIRRSVLSDTDLDGVRLYFHATVPTDLSIHIHSEVRAGAGRTSDLGIRLAAAMRDHGMVQHSVWIEDQSVRGPLCQ